MLVGMLNGSAVDAVAEIIARHREDPLSNERAADSGWRRGGAPNLTIPTGARSSRDETAQGQPSLLSPRLPRPVVVQRRSELQLQAAVGTPHGPRRAASRERG